MSHRSRFSELRQLLFGGDGLTPEEARYLKCLLSYIHTDIIGELPLEIVTLIALQLELNDFAHCLRVSKVWRQRFLSDSVMLAYARHRWPAMNDGVVNRSRFLETLLKLRWATKFWNPNDVGKGKGEYVSWDSTAQYTLDPVFHNQSDNLPAAYMRFSVISEAAGAITAFYAFGKVAWRLCGCLVAIDDLRSKTRKVFTPPSGTMYGSTLTLQSLGSRLVIGTIDRLLIAWDHVNNQAYEKLLPCRIRRCATYNNRAAVVLYSGDVVVWSPGHAAIQLDTSHLIFGLGINPPEAVIWKESLNVFFDPRNSKNLYLASGYLFHIGSKRMVRVTVHEFSETVHVASWSSDYQDPTTDGEDRLVCPLDDKFKSFISDCEIDYSYIVFKRWTHWEWHIPLIAFDKIKQKFVDIGYYPNTYFCYRTYYHNGHLGTTYGFQQNLTVEDGIVTGFDVNFSRTGYKVYRLTLLQSTRDKEPCQDFADDTETLAVEISTV
ncbi:hypothetical protein F4801DRAFT_172281 [Xylaria longipes]|nr:hypothetical protein F4801DRAFT_172281 [Xylaria longipes]